MNNRQTTKVYQTAEPEMQDSEIEMQEDNTSETVDNVVPEKPRI